VKRLHTGDAVRATQSRRCFEGALVLRALTARAPQPRPEDAAPVAGGDPGSLRFAPGACSALLKGPRQQTDAPPRRAATPAAFADAPPRQPQEAFARAAPQLGADFSSPNVAAQWKLRGLESSQRTPESPTRCALKPAAHACYMLTPPSRAQTAAHERRQRGARQRSVLGREPAAALAALRAPAATADALAAAATVGGAACSP
jgi:hypothetical protein